MSWHRSSGFSAVAIVALALLTAIPAWGATAGIDRDVLTGTGGGHPGNADFGLGSLANGIPGPYSVTWDFTPSAGVVQVRARGVGSLYLDRLRPFRGLVPGQRAGAGHSVPGPARLGLRASPGRLPGLRLQPHRQADGPVLWAWFRREQLGQSAGRRHLQRQHCE